MVFHQNPFGQISFLILETVVVISSQIHHDNAHVVRTMPSQGQLGQQNGRVAAGLVRALRDGPNRHVTVRRPGGRRGPLSAKAHARHSARGLVRDHVPQAIACYDETLVLCCSICDCHLRF